MEWLDGNPQAYMMEMQDYLREEYGVVALLPTICRALKKMRWARKVATNQAI